MKKIILFCSVVVLLLINTVGCSNGDTTDGETSDEKKIAILTPFLSSVTTGVMVEELKDRSEQLGWNVNVVDTNGDMGQLASRMEDVISSNIDAIVIVSTDPNQLQEQINLAAEKGIPVFGSDSSYIEGMTMNATSDNTEMSKLITEHLFEKMDGQGNLIVLTHRPHPGVLMRTQMLDELLEQYPNINVISEQEVQVPGPIENARQQMENLLLANSESGSITAVWAGWDEPAIGVTQAIQAANRDNEGIMVTGIDGTSQALEMIAQDSPFIATIQQNFEGMAEIVVKQMENYFDGNEVEDTQMYAPATLVNPENVSDFR